MIEPVSPACNPPRAFCARCLDAACAAPDQPDGGSTAIVEVPLEEARALHATWIGEGYDEPRRAGDLVGWCQSARVVVARGESVASAQLALFGAAS